MDQYKKRYLRPEEAESLESKLTSVKEKNIMDTKKILFKYKLGIYRQIELTLSLNVHPISLNLKKKSARHASRTYWTLKMHLHLALQELNCSSTLLVVLRLPASLHY